jgi:hypothetical protein
MFALPDKVNSHAVVILSVFEELVLEGGLCCFLGPNIVGIVTATAMHPPASLCVFVAMGNSRSLS